MKTNNNPKHFLDPKLFSSFIKTLNQDSFEEAIADPSHASMWVRVAVADPKIAEQLFRQCEDWIKAVDHLDQTSPINKKASISLEVLQKPCLFRF